MAAAASETFEAATGLTASRAAAGADAIAPAIPLMMFVTCSVPAWQHPCQLIIFKSSRHMVKKLTGAVSGATGL